jgi:hypothetical protein
MDMEIFAYESKTFIAIYLPGYCALFNRLAPKEPPVMFVKDPKPNLHLECITAKGRWERMSRHDAHAWVRRTQDHIKKQEKVS